MRGIFSYDSPFMQFLCRIADLMLLNLMILVFSLPLVTAGAAMAAAQEYVRKMRAEEAYGIRIFWQLFKSNFRQATVVYLLYVVLAAVCILDILLLSAAKQSFSTPLTIILFSLLLLGLVALHWAMLLIAYFRNSLGRVIINCALCTVLFLPRSLLILLLAVLPVAALFSVQGLLIALPLYLIVGFGLTAYLMGAIGAKAMTRLVEATQPPADPPEE